MLDESISAYKEQYGEIRLSGNEVPDPIKNHGKDERE